MGQVAFGVLLAPWQVVVPVSGQARQTVTVASVVDGDTIRVRPDGEPSFTLRLIGIGTPETEHPSKPVQRFG